MSKWHSMRLKHLIDDNARYLVWLQSDRVSPVIWDGRQILKNTADLSPAWHPTHFMPLPAKPDEP